MKLSALHQNKRVIFLFGLNTVFTEKNILFQAGFRRIVNRRDTPLATSIDRLNSPGSAMRTISARAFLAPLAGPLITLAFVALAFIAWAAAPARADDITPLVSVEWLAQHQGRANLVVLDVRSAVDGGGAEAYRREHIPGSVHSDYDKGGWRVTRNGIPFQLPTTAELEKLISELGIDEDSHVVVVPAGVHATDFGAGARVYWTLKVAGISRVSILDGGFAALVARPAAGMPGARLAGLSRRVLVVINHGQRAPWRKRPICRQRHRALGGLDLGEWLRRVLTYANPRQRSSPKWRSPHRQH